MNITSKGYNVYLTMSEAKALIKIVGKSSQYTLIKTFNLTEDEAQEIQSMFEKLIKVVPYESEIDEQL